MRRYNLVLSGSAALYPAHMGAAQALYETVFKGMPPKALIGTSGGAIVSSVLATGQEPKAGLPLLRQMLPKELIGKNVAGWWDRLLCRARPRLGLCTLDGVEEKLKGYAPKNFASAAIPLYITATDLGRGELVLFSCEKTPTVSCARAARISSSMPGLFALTQDGDRCLTDGGLLNNYPVDVVPGATIGVLLRGQGDVYAAPKYPRTNLELGIRCLEVLRQGLEREHIEDAVWARTIVVDVPWNALNFIGLSPSVVDRLYEAGYQQARDALDAKVLAAL